MAGKARPLEQRFWERIRKTDYCWIWKGAINVYGYGEISEGSRGKNNHRRHRAHRFSYQLHNGDIPEGLIICHRCDNRRCVNPDHLFVGTHDDNMKDMFSKGRRGIAENHPGATLTNEQVEKAIILRRMGMTFAEIAKEIGTKKGSITNIFSNKNSWASLDLEKVTADYLISWLEFQLKKSPSRPGVYVGNFKKMWVKHIGSINTLPEYVVNMYPTLLKELRTKHYCRNTTRRAK